MKWRASPDMAGSRSFPRARSRLRDVQDHFLSKTSNWKWLYRPGRVVSRWVGLLLGFLSSASRYPAAPDTSSTSPKGAEPPQGSAVGGTRHGRPTSERTWALATPVGPIERRGDRRAVGPEESSRTAALRLQLRGDAHPSKPTRSLIVNRATPRVWVRIRMTYSPSIAIIPMVTPPSVAISTTTVAQPST